MTLRRAGHLDQILARHPVKPRVFVESGTFKGKTTRWALERFAVVHTIELSDLLYAEAVETLVPLGAICHHGDTRDVLPMLANELDEPVCWFLDAHWLNREHAAGEGTPLPLADELATLSTRRHRDIVIVDDVASFGKDEYQPGWGRVSVEWVNKHFPKAAHVRDRDTAVVYR